MATDPTTLRRNVRAKLSVPVVLTGTDRNGKPFRISAESRDFSRTGLGVVLESDILAHGAVVTVTNAPKFRAIATVQWLRPDPATGGVAVGLRFMEAKTSFGLKIAAGLLLFFAFVSQISFAGSRDIVRAGPTTTVSQTINSPNGGGEQDEDQRSWIEQAIAKSQEAKANPRRAIVNIKLSKDTYRVGDTVAVSGYRVSNPSNTSQNIELKTWMSGPGVAPIAVGNVGADGLYVLSPGMDQEYGPLDLLPVSSNMAGGQGAVNARILDPVTGEVVGESLNSFTLATSAGNSSRAFQNQAPQVSIDSQIANTSFRSGDTVSMAAFRIMNHGASAATVEAKVWLEAPGLNPIPVFSLGADGSLVLTPGSDMALQPLESFKVTENLPTGNYVLKSRVLDPVTGEVFHESASSFEIR